jgi:phosphatidylinositol-3-phosphatase
MGSAWRAATRLGRTAKLGVLVLGVALAAGLLSASIGSGAVEMQSSAVLCGSRVGGTPPSTFAHVVWIWFENHSYSQVIGPPGSGAAQKSPYLNGTVVPGCGLASNYHNLSHPSLPNYIGATSGGLQGLTGNCAPAKCPQAAPSLFGQLSAAGKAWKSYAESMPSNCSTTGTSLYEVAHNAAPYYNDAAAMCPSWDVPLGTTTSGNLRSDLNNNTLPNFSFVIPNECNNGGCSITTGDTWLSIWLPLITASSAYQSGNTAVFITWDEGAGGSKGEDCTLSPTDTSCDVATLVVSPYTTPATLSTILYTHYSLLRTTEDMLGLSHLGHAADTATNSLYNAFIGSGSHGQPPVITSFLPVAGFPNTHVTITGSHFTGATIVQLGTTRAPFQVTSDTRIIATVPNLPVSSYKWSVTTPAGTGTSTSPFRVL